MGGLGFPSRRKAIKVIINHLSHDRASSQSKIEKSSHNYITNTLHTMRSAWSQKGRRREGMMVCVMRELPFFYLIEIHSFERRMCVCVC